MTLTIAVLAALAVGVFAGYVWAVRRTDRLLAAMNPAQLSTLAGRVRARRVSAGDPPAAPDVPEQPASAGR